MQDHKQKAKETLLPQSNFYDVMIAGCPDEWLAQPVTQTLPLVTPNRTPSPELSTVFNGLTLLKAE